MRKSTDELLRRELQRRYWTDNGARLTLLAAVVLSFLLWLALR